MPSRAKLRSPETWLSHIENHPQGFFITLNTSRHFPMGLTPNAYTDVASLEGPMKHISCSLRRYCLGRQCKELKDSIRFVAAYEIGPISGLLHVHLIMAHTESVNRSAEEIKRRLQRVAPKQAFGHWAFTEDIDVQLIGNARERIGYMTKDSSLFYRTLGIEKLTAF